MFSTQLMAVKKLGTKIQVTMRVRKKSPHAQYAHWEIKQWWPFAHWDVWNLNEIQIKAISPKPVYMKVSWQDSMTYDSLKINDTLQPQTITEVHQAHFEYLQQLQSWLLDTSLYKVQRLEDIQNTLLHQQELDWCMNDLFNRKHEVNVQLNHHTQVLSTSQTSDTSAPVLMLEFDHSNREVDEVEIIVESDHIPTSLYYQVVSNRQAHELRLYMTLNTQCHCDQYDSFMLTVINPEMLSKEHHLPASLAVNQHPHMRWISLWSLPEEHRPIEDAEPKGTTAHQTTTTDRVSRHTHEWTGVTLEGEICVYQNSSTLQLHSPDRMCYQVQSWPIQISQLLQFSKVHQMSNLTRYELPQRQYLITAPLYRSNHQYPQDVEISHVGEFLEMKQTDDRSEQSIVHTQTQVAYYRSDNDHTEYSLSDLLAKYDQQKDEVNHAMIVSYHVSFHSKSPNALVLHILEPDIMWILMKYYHIELAQQKQHNTHIKALANEIRLDSLYHHQAETSQVISIISLPRFTLEAYQDFSLDFRYTLSYEHLSFLAQNLDGGLL